MTDRTVDEPTPSPTSTAQTVGRWALTALLLIAGTGHLISPASFLAQVPGWFPAREAVVALSGLVELALAAALALAGPRRVEVGWVVAGLFVVIFPGNVSQLVTGTDAFGLSSDLAR